MLIDIDCGLRVDPAKVNVGTFLHQWLAQKSDIEPGSREKYDQIIEQHLVPTFGHLSLQQLRPDTMRIAYARWLEAGNRQTNGGLSPATIRKFHTVLRQALQTAIEDGLAARNVASGLRLPKGVKREKRVLTDEETQSLIAGTRDTVVHYPLLPCSQRAFGAESCWRLPGKTLIWKAAKSRFVDHSRELQLA
jgi:site-specific recombinase XerC